MRTQYLSKSTVAAIRVKILSAPELPTIRKPQGQYKGLTYGGVWKVTDGPTQHLRADGSLSHTSTGYELVEIFIRRNPLVIESIPCYGGIPDTTRAMHCAF